MFHIRKRNPLNPERQLHPMQLEIAVKHEYLPPIEKNWSNRWCTVSNDFEEYYEKVFNFETRTEDVFVVTATKSGTTWMLETVWILMNNLNYTKAKENALGKRTVHLESKGVYKKYPFDSVEVCNEMPSPRIIKSHLAANLLPMQCWKQKPKIIYVARNLKDFVVSSYNFWKGIGWWNGTIDEYVEDLINNELVYTPFWEHILDFWKLRHEPNIFFVTYEEMKRDLEGVLRKLCEFLERPQLTAVELQQTIEHLSFENMKENVNLNLTRGIKAMLPTASKDFEFMRRGIVGSYKDELSPEIQEKLSAWSREILSKHGIREEDIFGSVY